MSDARCDEDPRCANLSGRGPRAARSAAATATAPKARTTYRRLIRSILAFPCHDNQLSEVLPEPNRGPVWGTTSAVSRGRPLGGGERTRSRGRAARRGQCVFGSVGQSAMRTAHRLRSAHDSFTTGASSRCPRLGRCSHARLGRPAPPPLHPRPDRYWQIDTAPEP